MRSPDEMITAKRPSRLRGFISAIGTRGGFAYLTAGVFPVAASSGAYIEYGAGYGLMVLGGSCLIVAWLLGAD